MDERPIAVRFSKAFLKHADLLAKRLSEPGRRVTRSEVIRMAAYRGIRALRADKS
jgi:hypothetical protein